MAQELTKNMNHKYGSKPEVDQADLIRQAKASDEKRQNLQDQREQMNEKLLNRKRK